jgi:transcriptional regulator with XRE-family HTH domain
MRPTKRTPERSHVIFDALGKGLSRRLAAQLAGISEDTLSRWMKDTPEFETECKRREALCALECTDRIMQEVKVGRDGWKAAAAWLERRYPEEWSPRRQIEQLGDRSGLHVVVSYESPKAGFADDNA